MRSGIFITGTSTGVGKTFVAAQIMKSALLTGNKIRYFKPIQTGADCDCETIKKISGCSEQVIIRPVFSLQAPMAPYRAALLEGKSINVNTILQRWSELDTEFVIVEGAGGLMVPITENLLIRDLVKAFNIPLLIVATTLLGTINHTLLTVEAALSAGIEIAGIVLSGETDVGLSESLKTFTSVPVIAEIPWYS